jgi:hypothetical protein
MFGFDADTELGIRSITTRALARGSADRSAFVTSLERLQAWLRDACELGQRDALLLRCPGLLPLGDKLVAPCAAQTGSLPSEEALGRLESDLGRKLPRSYREFLLTVGWVAPTPWISSPRVDELASLAGSQASDLGGRFDSVEYADLYDEYLMEGYTDLAWHTWASDDAERILRPDEMVDHAFLPVELGNEGSPQRLLALHLRDEGGESPFFSSFSENLQIDLVARNAHVWFDRFIDESIASMAAFFTAR